MFFAKSIGFSAVAGLSLVLAVSAAEHTKESLAEIKQKVDDKKGVLVDVREKKEWDAGHVAGAVFLPLSSLQDGVTMDDLKPLPKDKILYVHCVLGKRALTVGNILEKEGYEVRVVKPGYKELISAGFAKAEE